MFTYRNIVKTKWENTQDYNEKLNIKYNKDKYDQ